ncbi:hypothetical protein LINPERPRIM_LOCUS25148, partial [Linum perenne]
PTLSFPLKLSSHLSLSFFISHLFHPNKQKKGTNHHLPPDRRDLIAGSPPHRRLEFLPFAPATGRRRVVVVPDSAAAATCNGSDVRPKLNPPPLRLPMKPSPLHLLMKPSPLRLPMKPSPLHLPMKPSFCISLSA